MTDYKNLCERLEECSTYGFKQEICKEAHDAIKELQAEIKKLRKLHAQAETDATNLTGELSKFYAENEQLKNQLSRKTEQLKAAVDDLRELARERFTCYACINNKFDYDRSVCVGCQYNNWNWQWRGEEKA